MSVHPRGGGDKFIRAATPGPARGSSPRGRGQEERARLPDGAVRFIPAGAGTSMWVYAPTSRATVHPRGGGDKVQGVFRPSLITGSSPRGRGQEATPGGRRGPVRFIPAGAGTSRRCPDTPPTAPVHPRGGGDKWPHLAKLPGQSGSSPRGRGQDTLLRKLRVGFRFIPAGAGTSSSTPSIMIISPVHPRGGGDKSASRSSSAIGTGSSPRGRGQGRERERAT